MKNKILKIVRHNRDFLVFFIIASICLSCMQLFVHANKYIANGIDDTMLITNEKADKLNAQKDEEIFQEKKEKKFIHNLNELAKYTEIDYNLKFNLRNELKITENELGYVLYGTNLYGLTREFISYADKYNINVLAFVAISIHESGWGSSNLAIKNNNIFGLNMSRNFKSKTDCIVYTGTLLDQKYLTQERVKNKQYSLKYINKIYCPPTNKWSYSIASIMEAAAKRIYEYRINTNSVFEINLRDDYIVN